MPSAFSNRRSSGPLAALQGAFGVTAVYTDKTQQVNCSVRLHRDDPRELKTDVGVSGEVQTGKAMVSQSELPRPVRGGRFALEGEVWSVEMNPTIHNGGWTCAVARVNPERHGEKRARVNG